MKSNRLTGYTLVSMLMSLLMSLGVFLGPTAQAAPEDFTGWPSADETDGKLLNISGPQFATIYIPTTFLVSIPEDATQFTIELFDGDGGELGTPQETYDIEFSAASYTYTLFADPLKDGSGGTVITTKEDSEFSDSTWVPFVEDQSVDAAAMAPSGNYFYRFEAVYNGDVELDIFNNGYMIRVRSNSPTKQAQLSVIREVSVVGVPNNFVTDPQLNTPGNTYNGDWNFFYFLPQADRAEITFEESDADYIDDADNPGAPEDDSTTDPSILISPSIRYEVFSARGELIRFESDPSGDSERESFVFSPGTPVPAGSYRWHWFGVDASNTWSMFVDGEFFTDRCEPDCLQPYLVGDLVCLDENQDGTQNPGELGIPGVCMNLIDSSGARIARTVTDSDGGYFFNTGTGEYTVEVCPENFAPPSPVGTLGDFVWLDVNADGVQDAAEPGLPDIRLNLFEAGGDGAPGGGDDVFVATTVTDVNGEYTFNDLPPGTYFVDLVESSVPLPLSLSSGPQSENDPSSVRTISSVGESFPDVDFGYNVGSAAIGDYVWIDANGDGIQDDNEASVDGVTLNLLDLGDDGALGGTGGDADTVVASRTTRRGGQYLFDGLDPDRIYAVDVTDAAGILAGFGLTTGPESSTDPTAPILLNNGSVILTADFGYNSTDLSSLSDSVWLDTDRDGIRDSGEAGFPNVTFNLLSGNGAVIASTTSDSDGRFNFPGLLDGDYRIAVTDLNGVLVDYLPTNQAPITGQAVTIAGADVAGNNFGYNLQGFLENAIATTVSPSQTNTVVNQNVLTYDFCYAFPPRECPDEIDFEADSSGQPITPGQIIDNEFQAFGITVTTNDPVNHPAMIFDSGNPTGDDFDLGTPNEAFGGPGVGAGGSSNDQPLGNVLIISEDGDRTDPDDHDAGGVLIFSFEAPRSIGSVELLDIEESGGEIRAFSCADTLIGTVPIPTAGDNSRQRVAVNAIDACRLEIELVGSGAVSDIDIICPDECVECKDAGASKLRLNITGGNNRDENETVRVYEFEPNTLADGFFPIRNNRDLGTLLFEGVVPNNMPFELNALSTGKEIVITVEGANHPKEFIKVRFHNDCKLQLGRIRNSRYLHVEITELEKPQVQICDSGNCERATAGTVRDDFADSAFDNNDGSRSWSSDWIEVDGRMAGPERGSVFIARDKLKLGFDPGTGASVAREVDLCASSEAELRIRYKTSPRVDDDDTVVVEVSPDGGGNYFPLDTFSGRQSRWTEKSYDISDFASSNTRVRFRVTNQYGGMNERYVLDWIEITSN